MWQSLADALEVALCHVRFEVVAHTAAAAVVGETDERAELLVGERFGVGEFADTSLCMI